MLSAKDTSDTFPGGLISFRTANKSRPPFRPRKARFWRPKTGPPTPGVTQKYIGFSEFNRKKISKLSLKCNKKAVTFLTKKATFCTILGAKTAILCLFARILRAFFCLDLHLDVSEIQLPRNRAAYSRSSSRP
jgi:hypothetical protein